MNETKKQGAKNGVWKLQNSIWLILALIPFVQWSAFFYIANRTDCKKFRMIGNVILAADMSAILAAFLSMNARRKLEEDLENIFYFLFLIIVPFSIIAGIACLKGYWRKALGSRTVRSGGIETITGRSHIWELKKTVWVLLGFVPFLFFTSFFFPAMKMKKKLYWGYFGVFGVLSIVSCTLIPINDSIYDFIHGFRPTGAIDDVMMFILFISHVFSLSLLMNIRAKYLKFINSEEMYNAVASQLQGGVTVSGEIKPDPEKASSHTGSDPSAFQSASAPSIASPPLLNINTCSEEALAALPGLNIIDAKRTISLREQNGDFESIEDFITALHIKPHIAAPLYDRITVQPSFKAAPQGTAHTRKIDL